MSNFSIPNNSQANLRFFRCQSYLFSLGVQRKGLGAHRHSIGSGADHAFIRTGTDEVGIVVDHSSVNPQILAADLPRIHSRSSPLHNAGRFLTPSRQFRYPSRPAETGKSDPQVMRLAPKASSAISYTGVDSVNGKALGSTAGLLITSLRPGTLMLVFGHFEHSSAALYSV